MAENKKFRIHWLGNSEPEDIQGTDMADAFTHAGYSAGALRTVDWIEEL